LIEAISHRIALGIKAQVPEHKASVAVLQYAVNLVLNTFSIVGFSLLAGVLTGRLSEAVIVLVSFALLRQVSGGYHLKSGMLCIAVSTIGVTIVSFADFNPLITLIMNGIAFILALIYAPSRIEKQTRIPVRYFKYLKLIAILMIIVSALIGNSVLAAAFMVQSLTLIRGGR